MKRFFLTRSFREKALTMVMLFIGLGIWFTLLSGRAQAFMSARREVAQRVEHQRIWLDGRDEIRARVEHGIDQLDPARTFTAQSLVGRLTNIGHAHQLNVSVDAPRSEIGDVFSYNTARVSIQQARIDGLIGFTEDLQALAPYLGIEEIVIRPDRNHPIILAATFYISSVELKEGAGPF